MTDRYIDHVCQAPKMTINQSINKYMHTYSHGRKISAPLQFCQKIQPFLFLVCIGTTQKKNRRKVKSETIPHKTLKNALDKIIDTLNLIFGSTLLDKITEINRSLWPWMSFSHLSTGVLDHSSFANCSRSFRFKGCILPTAVWDPSTGVLWDSDLDSLLAISELTCALFVSLSEWFLKCVSGHCPAGRPMTSGGDAAFWPLCCAQRFFGNHQISWYCSHSQGIQCQKQQILFEPPPFLTVGTVYFSSKASFLFL